MDMQIWYAEKVESLAAGYARFKLTHPGHLEREAFAFCEHVEDDAWWPPRWEGSGEFCDAGAERAVDVARCQEAAAQALARYQAAVRGARGA